MSDKSVHDSGTAVVELAPSEARSAKIAASKMGVDKDSVVMRELHRGFGEGEEVKMEDYPQKELMRFVAPSSQLSEVAVEVQRHGKERREKGHMGSKKKYYSIGCKIESQLVRQGEWVC